MDCCVPMDARKTQNFFRMTSGILSFYPESVGQENFYMYCQSFPWKRQSRIQNKLNFVHIVRTILDNFWPWRVREWKRECAKCRRRKAKACRQIMAPLPLSRLKTSFRTLTRTDVDFAGSFITMKRPGKRRMKRYLCIFTCLTSRVVHLEMAFRLATDSFLNTFHRMTSRRGLPDEIYSDNGIKELTRK